jgi:hypothetical protein
MNSVTRGTFVVVFLTTISIAVSAEASHYELEPDTYMIGRPGAYFHDVEALNTSVYVFGSTWTQAWECFDGFCFGPAYVHVINSDVAVEIEDPTGALVFATTVTTTANGGEYWFWPGYTFAGFHLDIPYTDFATIEGTYTARLSSAAYLPAVFPSDPLSAGTGDIYEATPWEGSFFVSEDQIPELDIDVLIDIKPGSFPNSINLGSAGVIPVAILSTPDFDAPAEVNPDTIGLAGARVKLVGKSEKSLCHPEDANADGVLDLVCQVVTAGVMIEEGESVAVLEAETFGGVPVRGEDTVRVVPDE